MSHAEVCPACRGEGRVYSLVTYDNTSRYYSGLTWSRRICPICDGKGWIEIPDNPEIPVASAKIPDVPGEEEK